ncbi:MAG: 5-oxoprolinase subunit PxpA [Bacteroidota bacterium]
MATVIDLNCDMGESWHNETVGQDAALMPHISSCNLACGVHGGDPATMRRTISLAIQHGVAIGAHPSLPGQENFGRTPIDLPAAELFEFLLTQVQTLQRAASELGAQLQHLKPHGALYNLATVAEKEAVAVCRICQEVGIKQLFGPPLSQLERQAIIHDLNFIPEGFIDRVYANGLQLRSRKLPHAIIRNSERAAEQAIRFVTSNTVIDYEGHEHPHSVRTLCIHGDHPEALDHILAVRAAFKTAGIAVAHAHLSTRST